MLEINLFFLLFLSACSGSGLTQRDLSLLPKELFREGDIAFRRGTGFTSRIVLAADERGTYSHTGILKWHNGAWYVIHAVPGEPDFQGDVDRVKMEPIGHFFDMKRAVKGAVMRMQNDSVAARKAAQSAYRLFQKHVTFDNKYDLSDTTELYCTELIDYVYRKEGIDIPQGHITPVNIPGFNGDYLMPNDIAQSKRLCLIYYF